MPLVDPRDARIAELEEQVAARDRRIKELMAQVTALTARVAELEARLNQNSTNSSKPPSSDPPGIPRPPRTKSGRRAGGQPGHKPHKRDLIPPEQVTHIVNVKPPSKCRKCKGSLKGRVMPVLRSQTVEVPPIKPVVTEYRCPGRECTTCKVATYAELPREAWHVFGARLTGINSLLSGKYRMSKRMVKEALSDLLGVKLCLGTVSNRDMEVSEALAPPVAEAEAFVRNAGAPTHMDETGWFEGKVDGRAKRAWLWVMATALVTVFRISTSRGSEIAKAMLGENFTGFLTTDRWSAYNWYDVGLRQLCWSHLTRDFQGFIDRGGIGGRLGRRLMDERNTMFRWWRRVRDGTMTREKFENRMKSVETTVGRLLRKASVRAEPKTAGMAAEILKLEQAMWTFVHVEGLEPTNNFGERTIRHSVMYRKTSFGTQSPEGSRFVERILTVVATLKQQQRNVLEFLTEAIEAHRQGLAPPSLLPAEHSQQLAIAA